MALSDALAHVAELQDALRQVEVREQTALELWLRAMPCDSVDAAYEECRATLETIKGGMQGELAILRMGSLL